MVQGWKKRNLEQAAHLCSYGSVRLVDTKPNKAVCPDPKCKEKVYAV